MTGASSWPAAYRALIADLGSHVANARPLIGGFSACLDIYLSLHEVERASPAVAGTPAEGLFAELARRAALSIGGELAMDWPDGPAWMDAHLPGRHALGGTSAQAAQQLAVLGARALVALADRSEEQLAVIHPDVLVATKEGAVARGRIRPKGPLEKPPHYIFEYTAGETVGGRKVPRSSRTIVRFSDATLEHDRDFERVSLALAGKAGAGIICGFNEVAPAILGSELAYAAAMARAWRARGLSLVHLEIGDYKEADLRDRSLEEIAPAVSSMGMSLSELRGLCPGDEAIHGLAIRLAERFGLSRVCIHADEWAMAVTRNDPERERAALMMGCLLAASRASVGHVCVPEKLPDSARFSTPPLPTLRQQGRWSVVHCPAPYLARPVATIGLGDTFLAGTLLVLGAAAAKTAASVSAREIHVPSQSDRGMQ